MTLYQELGLLGLASRIRGLAENLMTDGLSIYQLAGVDFNPRWFGVYYLLLQHKALAITDISQMLGQSHPAVIKVVGPMTKAGLVVSKKNEDDGRKRMITLTQNGLDLETQLQPIWQALQDALEEMFLHLQIDMIGLMEQIETEIDRQPVSSRFHQAFKRNFRKQVTIIDFEPEFRDSFRVLNEEWLRDWFKIEPSDKKMLNHPEQVIESGGYIFFAKVDRKVVGTVALLRDSNKRFEIAKMAVSSPYRNRGIGRMLLEEALQKAQELDCESVFLQTSPRLTGANLLYKKMGFKETSHISCGDYQRQTKVLWLEF